MLKTCTMCGVAKQLDAFPKRKDSKSGYRMTCNECTHKQRFIYRGGDISKTCRVCGIEKPLKDFYENWRCRDGYMSLCKECNASAISKYYQHHKEEITAKHRADRADNKEKWLERERKYHHENKEKEAKYRHEYRLTENGKLKHRQDTHRRRSQIKDSETKLSPDQWRKILKTQNDTCNICKNGFTKKRPPTIDHIIPLFHGGNSKFENIQALCASCNSKKQAKLDPQFIQTWTHNGTEN